MAGENGGLISGGYNPLEAPDAPTSVSGSAGDASIDVSFTAPSDVGGAAIQTYIAVATASGETTAAEGESSPVTISGLTNGTAYSISAYAKNTYGYSPAGLGAGTVSPAAGIGLFTGGASSGGSISSINVISTITITTTGNATDFGDLLAAYQRVSSCGSTTRGVTFGGSDGSRTNVIQYNTFASAGNAIDFGDLVTTGLDESAACSSATRGLVGGGRNASGNSTSAIEYITIATTGNASSFGNLTVAGNFFSGCSSPTRGVFSFRNSASNNVIDYVTIASTGNATDFGDANPGGYGTGACSSSTRGLFGGLVSNNNTIQYITIATTGNTTDFGDLTVGRGFLAGCSSQVRGIFAGGDTSGAGTTQVNVIDYVTIASTGNATDFGDLTTSTALLGACSSAHGGLS